MFTWRTEVTILRVAGISPLLGRTNTCEDWVFSGRKGLRCSRIEGEEPGLTPCTSVEIKDNVTFGKSTDFFD